MKTKIAATLASVLFISACASPEVVDTRKAGDNALNCSQIRYEIAEADKFEERARKEKGVTGTNVAATLFFWPALLVTQSNANEAIDAAKDRKATLIRLADQKRCKL